MSQDFIEKIVILLMTALLTGFLVPYILKRVDERKARQNKIIEAQSKFLDDFAQLLWKWRYRSIKVVYYGSANDIEQYRNAGKDYEENIWGDFNQVRKEISTSRRLVSEDMYKQLRSFYSYIVDLDKKISSLLVAGPLTEVIKLRAKDLNDYIYTDVTDQIDKVVNDLASELHLKAQSQNLR